MPSLRVKPGDFVRIRGLFAAVVAVAALSAGAVANRAMAGARTPGTTWVSGPLAVAVRDSELLSQLVVVDSFWGEGLPGLGRAYTPGFANFDGLLSNQFQSQRAFAGTMHSALGTVQMSGVAVHSTTPRLAAPFRTADGQLYDLRNFEMSAALTPDLTVSAGYNLDMAGRFNSYDAMGSGAYDGLFFSAAAVNSPYVSLTDGGDFVGAAIRLADDLHFRVAAAAVGPRRDAQDASAFSSFDGAAMARLQSLHSALDLREAQSTLAGVTWDFANWGGVGVSASQTTEHHGLLGGVDAGAASLTKSARTSAVGVSARLGFGDGWVTSFSYNEGVTQLSLRPGSIVADSDSLHSRAYGVAVAKHGLFSKSDALGLALTRPVHVYSGGVDLAAPAGIGANRSLQHVSLASSTPETDVELGYVTTFFDGALALQANAGYQMNVAGQSGTNSVTVLSRAKINF